jgi:hypothetical protein
VVRYDWYETWLKPAAALPQKRAVVSRPEDKGKGPGDKGKWDQAVAQAYGYWAGKLGISTRKVQ